MRRLIAVLVVCALLCGFTLPARAAVTPASAGRMISELMTLIADEYVGSEVTEAELLEAAIHGMTTALDPYSEYMDAETLARFTGSLSGKMVGLGVHIRLNDKDQAEIARVLPDTPAQEAGLRKGDIIAAVNAKATDGLALDEVIALIGEAKSTVSLRVRRGGQPHAFDLVKREIPSISVYTESLPEMLGEAAKGHEAARYIAVTSISDNTAAALETVVAQLREEKAENVILDFRGNAGGYLNVAVDICNMFVPAGIICHIVDAHGNKETVTSALREKPFARVVVLVDRYSASASELIAAALQDAGAAVVVGETTFGKGVIQTVYNLSTGGGLKLTVEEYLRPKGGKINGVGVKPDYEIETALADYETPGDAALLKALETFSHE